MTSLYDLTIPVLTRVVQTEVTLLKKAEAYAKEIGTPVEDFITARLAPDMFPLSLQVVVTTLYSKKAIHFLAGGEEPNVEAREHSLQESYALLADALNALSKVEPESINGKESEIVHFSVSKRKTSAPAIDCMWTIQPHILLSSFQFDSLDDRSYESSVDDINIQ